ncbi:MAG: outer membrane beta-barrel protein [Bacteroidetes bacterium]|nr:outer membrane beta-barrel protein [Bacteroidota bacterium]
MRKSILILCFLVLPALAFAGRPPGGEDDILRPVPWSMHVGPYAGGAWILSQGNFNTLCDCEYGSGSGVGFQLGAFADYPLTNDVSLFATLGYRMLNAVYEKSQQRLEYVPVSGGGDFMWVDFDLETRLSISLMDISLAAKWDLPVKGLYLAAGPEFGLSLLDNIEETETITTPGLTYDSNGQGKQTFMDDNLDRYYSDAASFRLGFAARLGYILPIHERLAIAPELSMSLPLTPVASDYGSWRLMAWQFNVYLRFAI